MRSASVCITSEISQFHGLHNCIENGVPRERERDFYTMHIYSGIVVVYLVTALSESNNSMFEEPKRNFFKRNHYGKSILISFFTNTEYYFYKFNFESTNIKFILLVNPISLYCQHNFVIIM